jgi:ribose 5-phosphate isomerase B
VTGRKVIVGCDHAGLELKRALVEALTSAGHPIEDLGTNDTTSCDYPDFAHAVAERVARGDGLGLLICGTGLGMSITANKHAGVRAACVSDTFSARMTRMHNDANVLCLGARVVGAGLAIDIVSAFFGATFEGGRHAHRVGKIEP